MSQTAFSELELSNEINRAVSEMGFEYATEIQSKAIPIIRRGNDVIGKSQTGTGKTVAFGIPAIEAIDTSNRITAQVLILCPTRELAVQACDEIRKLSQFKHGIKAAEVYGGAPMDRQIAKLKTANIIVGTPGRVMDHMRRKTLKLNNLKMIVLDEADEMLSMGFREDIETILQETPEERQTILFSATMPPEILSLTRKYQRNPQLVDVKRKQVTVENIEQYYYDVPMGRKMDALNLLLKYHAPKLSMIFCNTKKMVDDITDYLCKHGFSAQGLHGDMKQSQRTKVMDSFKSGKSDILVATDVAARGIDVNDIDYVINYDIPQNTEYYVHRIGRTGRAGKSGKAITICSGKKQVEVLKRIGKLVRADIKFEDMPSIDSIKSRKYMLNIAEVEKAMRETTEFTCADMVKELMKRGYDPILIATVLMEMHFGVQEIDIKEIKSSNRGRSSSANGNYKKIVINIGRMHRVAPNHIVGAITEKTDLCGGDIGKIEIFDNKTVVSIPEDTFDTTLEQMKNCKICGNPTITTLYKGKDKYNSNKPKMQKQKDFKRKRHSSDRRNRKR